MALGNTADNHDSKFHINDHLRGVAVMVLGCAALVGLAFGAMVLLTSPDGWVTKAANSALSGEQTSLVSFDMSSAE